MSADARLDTVERRLSEISSRLRRLEGREVVGPELGAVPPAPTRSVPAPVVPQPAWASPESARRSDRGGKTLEELFGGRVLAWIGALAILIGAALFMGMAISHDWLDEQARTIIGFLGSTALLVAGVWLHERKGHLEAASAAVASAISGLYVTLLVATQSYGLLSTGLGLAIAAIVAVVGLAIAVRWSSTVVAAIGALGALAAPLLVGAGTSGTSIAFVAVALAGTVGILVWQRWGWLTLGAFLVSVPQLVAWVLNNGGDSALVLAVLVGFWALYVVAAFGYELRARGDDLLPIASWMLLIGSAAMVVGLGYHVLTGAGAHDTAVAWVLGFAAVHLVLGDIARRYGIQREISALLIGTGLALSAFGLAEALHGPALVAAWSVEGVCLAYLATRVDSAHVASLSSAERMLVAAGGFLTLAFGHVLFIEAPPSALFNGVADLGAALSSIAVCALGALAFHRLTRTLDPLASKAAGFAGAASLVYLGSVAIVDTIGVTAAGEARQAGQVWLSAFWTATGLGALVVGLVRRSASIRLGGLALLGLAIAKVWTYDLAELDELSRVLSFIGLGLLLLVGAFAYQRIRPGEGADSV